LSDAAAETETAQAPGEARPGMRMRLPFRLGDRVRHDCAHGNEAIVVAVTVFPHDIAVYVSAGLGEESWCSPESISGCEEPRYSMVAFPFLFGEQVKHRADGRIGIVTGFKVACRGVEVQVSWAHDKSDWHAVCEFEA
jgi:hypothetical protein